MVVVTINILVSLRLSDVILLLVVKLVLLQPDVLVVYVVLLPTLKTAIKNTSQNIKWPKLSIVQKNRRHK